MTLSSLLVPFYWTLRLYLFVSETACRHGDQSFERRMKQKTRLVPFSSRDCVNYSARFPGSILPTPGSPTPELANPHRGLPDQAEAPQAAVRPAPAVVLVLLPLPSASSARQPRLLAHQAAGLLPPHVRVVAEIPPADHHRLPNQGKLLVTLSLK